MDEEVKEDLSVDFLGDRVESNTKKDLEDPEKEHEKDPEEIQEDQTEKQLDRELGLFEFVYTDGGNVLMNQETYQRLMSKFM